MNKYDNIKSEIDNLIKDGNKLYDSLAKYTKSKDATDFQYFTHNYELWYTKSLLLIKQVLPFRLEDFTIRYRNDKRKGVNSTTYTISDALLLLDHVIYAAMPLSQQIEIVKACRISFESEIYNIQSLLQADIFDSEIESAKHLLKKGFLRAAGAICGVVIEKHFSEVCKNHNITIKKKSPTIADYNDALKDSVYDTIEWRRIQRLGDLRNLCDHSKDREPIKDEVEELICGTERVIKTVF